MVKNYTGTDCVGRNHYDRSRHATKVLADRPSAAKASAVICDDNKIPLSVSFDRANVNDASLALPLIKTLPKVIKNRRYTNHVIGDKGYILNQKVKKEIISKHKAVLITPYRRNQKKKNTSRERNKLKQRFNIEVLFNRLDNFTRIKCRNERLSINFESFHYLAFIVLFFQMTN